MKKFLELIVGGSIGTIARYSLSGLVYNFFGSSFSYGTLVVNLLGCFILGVLFVVNEKSFLGADVKMFLIVGFCGAFTTFSTFILETLHLIKDGQTMKAFLVIFLSMILGFACLELGILLGDKIFH